MKTFIATVALLVTALSSFAQISPVRMDVIQKQKTDSKGKSNESKKQIRSLEITIQNVTRNNLDSVDVKYWFFTKGMKDNDVDVFKSGEKKTSIAAGKKEIIESEEVSSSYTSDHYQVNKGKGNNNRGGNNKGGRSVKKVEGSGDKLVGYGVRVSSEGKVIAEFFSPQGMKEKVQ
jgi:hypothetical protein